MKKRQEGSAMILVMCVMIVIVALSLALLLTASVLTMNANRSNQKEQCRIAAVSMSEALRDEIVSKGKYTTEPDGGGPTDTLEGKLHTVFSTEWIQYHSDAGTVQQIQIDAKGIYNYEMVSEYIPQTKTTVQMYWMQSEEEDREPEDTIEDRSEKFSEVTLYIKVTCTVGEEASTIISTYKPENITINDAANDYSWEWAFDGNVWEGGDS